MRSTPFLLPQILECWNNSNLVAVSIRQWSTYTFTPTDAHLVFTNVFGRLSMVKVLRFLFTFIIIFTTFSLAYLLKIKTRGLCMYTHTHTHTRMKHTGHHICGPIVLVRTQAHTLTARLELDCHSHYWDCVFTWCFSNEIENNSKLIWLEW